MPSSTGKQSAGDVAVYWYWHFSSSETLVMALSVPQVRRTCGTR